MSDSRSLSASSAGASAVDEETFDELQLELKNSFGKSILALLDEANVEPGVADRLCGAILFDITAQIDGEHDPLMYKGRADPTNATEII